MSQSLKGTMTTVVIMAIIKDNGPTYLIILGLGWLTSVNSPHSGQVSCSHSGFPNFLLHFGHLEGANLINIYTTDKRIKLKIE